MSCSFKTFEIYSENYPANQSEQLINDIYKHFVVHNIEIVELKDWYLIQSSSEKENTLRRVFTLKENFREELNFVYTIHVTPDSTYYNFAIYKRER